MVRPPKAKDFQAIRDVVAAAFGRDLEADIVEGVRAEGEGLIELVAEEAGEVVGYILFSRMGTVPTKRIAGLGPVAVRPDRQGRGVGDALCRAGIEAVKALGAEAIVVLGHPPYYPRFGFSAEAARRIASPFAGNPAFMAMELEPGALAEPVEVAYPAAFH